MMADEDRNRLIRNPLRERTGAELDEDVRRAHTRLGLQHIVDLAVLQRGARAGQNPKNPRSVPGISDADALAIEQEENQGFTHQTKFLKVAILTTAVAAAIQGFQQSSINTTAMDWGAEFFNGTSMQVKDLNKASLNPDVNPLNLTSNGLLLFGFINAAPPLFGSLIGTWISDPLQERFTGRLPALFVAAVFSAASVIGSAYSRNWKDLLACRALLGIGMGSKASIAPVIAAEVAPDHLRGSLTMSWQLFDAFGIMLGFATAAALLPYQSGGGWRVMLASPLIPAVPLLLLLWICPESPRFLMRNGRFAEAYQSMRRLRGTELQACRDFYLAHCQLQMEAELARSASSGHHEDGTKLLRWYEGEIYQQEVKKIGFWQRIWKLATIGRNRRACYSSFVVMGAQILCGVNIITFYSSALFSSVGHSTTKATWLSLGFGITNFVATFPVYKRIDSPSYGRRWLLLFSLFGTTFSLLVTGQFFRIENDNVRVGMVAMGVIVFALFYSIGGPIPFTFSAEAASLAYREVSMSFSVMVNFLGLGILVLFVPQLTYALRDKHPSRSSGIDAKFPRSTLSGYTNLLSLFTGFSALSFLLVFFIVPSTAKPKLEEMDYIFRRSTLSHVKFQAMQMIPWHMRRIFLRRSLDENPEPEFMEWSEDQAIQTSSTLVSLTTGEKN